MSWPAAASTCSISAHSVAALYSLSAPIMLPILGGGTTGHPGFILGPCCTAPSQSINYGKQREVSGKQRGSPGGAAAAGRRGDLAGGSIRGWPETRRRARGLAEIVASSVHQVACWRSFIRPEDASARRLIRRTLGAGRASLMDETPTRSTREERLTRLLDAGDLIHGEEPGPVLYAHTVLCQTGLPYRNPGDVREWERANGAARLKVLAGEAMHPETGEFVKVGLPYGPKPRLILAHLNGEALRRQSPWIEIEDSLTAFVKRLRLDPKGRNITAIKDQLARLSASSIRLGYVRDGRAVTVNSQIVTSFDLWFPRVDGQRVLWPSAVQLSADYFDSLTRHAVPLHEIALAALSGNAMALDVYAWLAQRLHRVDPARPVLVPWPALQAQFGWHYDRLDNFRPVFRRTLSLVVSQYRGARVDLDRRGMMLSHSQTPVKGRTAITVRKD